MGHAIKVILAAAPALALVPGTAHAADPAPRKDRLAFRELYKELVETDTSVATGSCTALGEKIAGRFKQAGIADTQLTLFKDNRSPLDGGPVVTVPGSSTTAKPMLLLGHLDVVNARREDWKCDPYTFIKEDGYFYGRGTSDMKVLDAIWIDTLIRYKADGYRRAGPSSWRSPAARSPTPAWNGVQWLAEHQPDLIAAAIVLNEGGGGDTDGHGKLVSQTMQVGEKSNRSYELQATNPGGHSSIPVDDNAI